MSKINKLYKKKIKIEDIIDMTNKMDHIFHDHGFFVNHDILSTYILRIIKESYPYDSVELEKPNISSQIDRI